MKLEKHYLTDWIRRRRSAPSGAVRAEIRPPTARWAFRSTRHCRTWPALLVFVLERFLFKKPEQTELKVQC